MSHPLDTAFGMLQFTLIVGSLAVWFAIIRRLASGRPLVPYEPRLPVPWSGFDLAVLAFGVLLLDSIALRALGVDVNTKVMSVPQVIGISATRLTWLVFAVIYLSRKAGAYADDMGFDLRSLGADLRLAGLTFLAAVLPVYGVQWLMTEWFGYKSEHMLKRVVEAQPSGEALFWTSVAAVAVAPLIEEFLIRVLLQGWMEKKDCQRRERWGGDPDRPAGFLPIVIAGAIFAVLHDWPDQVALLVLSLFLGYVYQRTHRIVAPLAVHIAINIVGMLQLWRAYFVGTP